MCGRFTLRAPASVIAAQFSLFEVPFWKPRFNIAPTQPVPVVRMNSQQAEPRREFVLLHWGLVPSWAADPAIGNRLINARAETAADKPSFRAAMRAAKVPDRGRRVLRMAIDRQAPPADVHPHGR